MALVKCVRCGAEISANADICLHCQATQKPQPRKWAKCRVCGDYLDYEKQQLPEYERTPARQFRACGKCGEPDPFLSKTLSKLIVTTVGLIIFAFFDISVLNSK